MLDAPKLSFAASVEMLKALGEPTRLRLVRLLARNDLTVSDLTAILGQSQPRISRHLRLLVDCGLLTRAQEGAWAFFRLSDRLDAAALAGAVLARLDEGAPDLSRDAERLGAIRAARAARAAAYFAENAERWDRLRGLHAPDAEVEAVLLRLLGDRRFADLLDVGTGTGRMLELLSPRAERAVGVDASPAMLQVARAKLDAGGVANVQLRQGDCYGLPLPRASVDLVTIHQVLHYLHDPFAAVREAAATLRPGGLLAIVDFAPHDFEFLRDDEAHLRLGFSEEVISGFLADAGLDLLAFETLAPATAVASQPLGVFVALAGRRIASEKSSSNPTDCS